MSAARSVSVAVQCARGVSMPTGADVTGWVGATVAKFPGASPGEVVLRLVDEAESRELNGRYRGRDAPTNVLAFPAAGLPGLPQGAGELLGDLVICMPLLRAEAAAQHKAPLAHLAHLVVHGTLHLLGMDHDHDAAAARMEAVEREILAGLGFDDPYRVEQL
jgi:probable rRNA maturation factor